MVTETQYTKAIMDFQNARRKADLQEIMARITGKSTELLNFEEVRSKLHARESSRSALRDIPLDAIVGSVGRYTDFTRDFLPRQEISKDRWARIMAKTAELEGLPPIEVYQIGDAYFVLDGNHRVSVAREMGASHIQAYVTELQTRVPVTPDTVPEDLIVKAEYVDFLEHTKLDEHDPEADFSVTCPGRYQVMLDHIAVHRYFMGTEQFREVPFEEAAVHWYETVYLPVVRTIRERNIMRFFPGRTEADLYLWITKYQAELRETLGWQIETDTAAEDLAKRFSRETQQIIPRVTTRILDAVTPDALEAGPPTGTWRHRQLTGQRQDTLFANILVPISGEDIEWQALEQALVIAQKEQARLRGLHIVADKTWLESESVSSIQKTFNQRCQEANIPGEFALSIGTIARKICERSQFADLTVVHLAYPPEPGPIAKLGSGFRLLIRRCSTPVLAVPSVATNLESALLAYDGSSKAQEALFIAAYLAGKWGIKLSVITANEDPSTGSRIQADAKDYLENQGIEAAYANPPGPAAEAILECTSKQDCELIIMGGYSRQPVVEVVLGSVVDQVLRGTRKPVLICR
jgi:nucleotide-binding universal stress UspA family protein